MRSHLSQNSSYTDISLLNIDLYFVDPITEELYFRDHFLKPRTFTLENVNLECDYYKLNHLPETTFHQLVDLLSKGINHIQTNYSSQLKDVMISILSDIQSLVNENPIILDINSVISGDEPMQSVIIKDKLTRSINGKYMELIYFLEKNFQNQINKNTRADGLTLVKKLYKFFQKINQETMQDISFGFLKKDTLFPLVNPYVEKTQTINNNVIIARKNALLSNFDIKEYEFTEGIKDAIQSIVGNNKHSWNQLVQLISNTYNISKKSNKLTVILCNSYHQNSLCKFLEDLFPDAVQTDGYRFNNDPSMILKLESTEESKLKIICNPTVTRFTSEKLYHFFHGKSVKYEDENYKCSAPFVVLTHSTSDAKKIAEQYDADYLEFLNFQYDKRLLLCSLEELRNTLILFGLYMSKSGKNKTPASKAIATEFLTKYTRRNKNTYVLSTLLLDSLKDYAEYHYGKISIKNYSSFICDYIGDDKALRRMKFSNDEISQLPEKYREALLSSKRPISRRFCGLQFDYETFKNQLPSKNDIDFSFIKEITEAEFNEEMRLIYYI